MPALMIPGAPGRGALLERRDPLARQRHHAIAGGVGQRAQQHPPEDVRSVRRAPREQPGQVGVEQAVAVADQEGFVQQRRREAQRAAGAGGRGSMENPIRIGRGNACAASAIEASSVADRCPASSTHSSIPKRESSRISQNRNGRPPISSTGFGVAVVSAPSLVPRPPARIAHWRIGGRLTARGGAGPARETSSARPARRRYAPP